MAKAFLLAGGLGTRLRPLTDSMPKCLLPIDGVPLLSIWFELLERAGVEEVLLNTHWLADKVDAFVEKYQGPLKVTTFYEANLLGSAGTIIANREWIGDTSEILILYADNLTTVDLSGMLEFHYSHKVPFTLGVFHAPEPKRCGIVEVDEQGIVMSFEEKPETPKSDFAAGGIYVADTALIDEWDSDVVPYDLGTHVLPTLAGRMKIKLLDGLLVDIGTPQSYAKAQELYKKEFQR
jgi:mannose-1-phosphate guanylyltransferase